MRVVKVREGEGGLTDEAIENDDEDEDEGEKKRRKRTRPTPISRVRDLQGKKDLE